MSEDDLDFDPLDYVEEDRDVLERIALARLRATDKDFPAHLLTTDPLVARQIIQKARAERQVAKIKPPPEPPVVTATLVTDYAGLPRSVGSLIKLLTDWTFTLHYAKGSPPGRWARLEPEDPDTVWVTKVVESYVLRARRHAQWFVVSWEDAKIAAAFWVDDVADTQHLGTHAKKVSITELKKRVKA